VRPDAWAAGEEVRVKEQFRDGFISLWKKHFGGAGLPVAFYYTDAAAEGGGAEAGPLARCVVANMDRVRKGETVRFAAGTIGCPGGKRYLGYSRDIRPGFEYFLSCGIPGEMEGERYKKSPELVREVMARMPEFEAPGRFVVFKRWDRLEADDNPEVVVFFARPDVLAGLFTLSSFDEVESSGVIAPFAAGCGSIVLYPYLERASASPRCVIGMFDPSARPYVGPDELTFAAPFAKFERMVADMDQSFLITPTWERIRERIERP
jgi:uncharacterized protein (DUF169 family)